MEKDKDMGKSSFILSQLKHYVTFIPNFFGFVSLYQIKEVHFFLKKYFFINNYKAQLTAKFKSL